MPYSVYSSPVSEILSAPYDLGLCIHFLCPPQEEGGASRCNRFPIGLPLIFRPAIWTGDAAPLPSDKSGKGAPPPR